MRTNKKDPGPNSFVTYEGAPGVRLSNEQQLRRAVMSCLLWEKSFYESGEDITTRIASLIPKVDADVVALIACDARIQMKLRHIPLFIACEMLKHPEHKKLVSKVLSVVIQRPDEITEFLALYWKNKKTPIAAQAKKGLASAFNKFNEYQFAKYDRDDKVKLRDALFMVRPSPIHAAQARVLSRLANRDLPTPDTWETALSSGADKKYTWSRLISEGKLGALAFLRNLRNMREAGVSQSTIIHGLRSMRTERVLPYRFIAAATHAPELREELEKAMFKCLEGEEKIPGRTILLVDVSGSMEQSLSSKSDLTRLDAACGLAMLIDKVCERKVIFTFSNQVRMIPDFSGFELKKSIVDSQPHGGTYLGAAVEKMKERLPADRIIVITDEQSADPVGSPIWKNSYMVNVSTDECGVGYGDWTRIHGFSESIVSYIREFER